MTNFCDGLFASLCVAFATVSSLFSSFQPCLRLPPVHRNLRLSVQDCRTTRFRYDPEHRVIVNTSFDCHRCLCARRKKSTNHLPLRHRMVANPPLLSNNVILQGHRLFQARRWSSPASHFISSIILSDTSFVVPALFLNHFQLPETSHVCQHPCTSSAEQHRNSWEHFCFSHWPHFYTNSPTTLPHWRDAHARHSAQYNIVWMRSKPSMFSGLLHQRTGECFWSSTDSSRWIENVPCFCLTGGSRQREAFQSRVRQTLPAFRRFLTHVLLSCVFSPEHLLSHSNLFPQTGCDIQFNGPCSYIFPSGMLAVAVDNFCLNITLEPLCSIISNSEDDDDASRETTGIAETENWQCALVWRNDM